MMPGEDGLSICRRLSGDAAPPIIIMSAMGDDVDRIIGLELGADDYLAKPCNPRELQARIRAVLRRRAGSSENGRRTSGLTFRFAGYELNVASRRLRGPTGVVILLTRSEFTLLTAFLERSGEVLSRDQLMDYTRGADTESFDRVIDVQISRLRRKLGDRDGQEVIRTIRGAGYKLNPPVTRQ
jgi:two-component system OmpR family response regulator